MNSNIVKKKVLHVGCGQAEIHASFKTPEWEEVRLDLDPKVKADIYASITDMKVIADNSFDAIYSSHNLEHLYPHEVPAAMSEFYRVINQGGGVLLTMPDVQKVAEEVYKGKWEEALYISPSGPICPIDIFYGLRPSLKLGAYSMAHKNGFTASSLFQKLKIAGFVKITIKREGYNLWARAFKDKNVDPKTDKLNLVEPDINDVMTKRDNIAQEPEGFEIIEMK